MVVMSLEIEVANLFDELICGIKLVYHVTDMYALYPNIGRRVGC